LQAPRDGEHHGGPMNHRITVAAIAALALCLIILFARALGIV
jgi:hypothetical protein